MEWPSHVGLKNAEIKTMNQSTKKTVEFRDLGNMDYQEAWTYQEKLFEAIVTQKIQNRNLPEDQQVITPSYLLFV